MKEGIPEQEQKPETKIKKKGSVVDKVARYDANLAAIRIKNEKGKNPSKIDKRKFHAAKIDEKLMEGNRYANFKPKEQKD